MNQLTTKYKGQTLVLNNENLSLFIGVTRQDIMLKMFAGLLIAALMCVAAAYFVTDSNESVRSSQPARIEIKHSAPQPNEPALVKILQA